MVAEICTRGPPPLTFPSATIWRPCRRTETVGNWHRMRFMLSARSFCARMSTPTLDGIITVMSPLPVARNESASLAPNSVAMIFPSEVETRIGPAMFVTRIPPEPDSHCTPPADVHTHVGRNHHGDVTVAGRQERI